jgi:hypothetical protein
MGKFYCISGNLQKILSAPHIESYEDAACEAILIGGKEGVSLAPLIIVSELGFDLHSHPADSDKVFATNLLLKKTGLLNDEGQNYD